MIKKYNNLARRLQRRPGLTLVELLVVIAVGVVVSGVAFSLYRINTNYYLENEANLLLQQNLRVAISVLSRDARMAGNGLSVLGPGFKLIQAYAPFNPGRACGAAPSGVSSLNWVRHCDSSRTGARAIFGEDGEAKGSDILTIFRATPEYSVPVGEVLSFENSSLELTLETATDVGAVKPGAILAIAVGESGYLMEVEKITGGKVITFKKDGRFTNPSGLPSSFQAEKATVYNLNDVSIVTYFVDETANQLMVLSHDQAAFLDGGDSVAPVAIADNIEDLQIYYYFKYKEDEVDNSKLNFDPIRVSGTFNGDSTHFSNLSDKLDRFDVKAVTIGLTAKSSHNRGRGGFFRPALFNHEAGLTKDNYLRESIMETVQLRNF
jgi:prepilin-type N-terminal cleavage/methylation domain-containing protein